MNELILFMSEQSVDLEIQWRTLSKNGNQGYFLHYKWFFSVEKLWESMPSTCRDIIPWKVLASVLFCNCSICLTIFLDNPFTDLFIKLSLNQEVKNFQGSYSFAMTTFQEFSRSKMGIFQDMFLSRCAHNFSCRKSTSINSSLQLITLKSSVI